MELHLPLVLATPTLLCLLAAVATWVWPCRVVVWPFVLPAALLAIGCLGLLPCRGEVTGPAVHWLRLDVPGLVVNALALPVAVGWGSRSSRNAGGEGRIGRPWRFAAWLAVVAAAGLTPLPLAAVAVWPLGPFAWRRPAGRRLVAALFVLASASWPWSRLVDAISGLTLAVCAGSWSPTSQRQRVACTLVAVGAGIAFARACGLS